jgi:glutamine amidotransferase of anthranilate synthase or aminodeoxychorismate synthase
LDVLVIDNYDSFVYNLVHYLEELDCKVTVVRNDQIALSQVDDFDKILISPGPGVPEDAGNIKQIIEHYAQTKCILGICLGLQAICEVFGGSLEKLDIVKHGISSNILVTSDNEPLFKGLENNLEAGRYHSWIVSQHDLPGDLEITSVDENDQIMSLRHKKLNIRGVQFHPESILTPLGKKIIKNWLSYCN